MNATPISIPDSTSTAHVTASPFAPASTASKSQSLRYAGTFRVSPSAVTGTVGASPLALNAGKPGTYSSSSRATVALSAVSGHCPGHGHMPMSKSGAAKAFRVRHVRLVSNDVSRSARAP